MNTVKQTVVIQDVLEQAQFNQTTWNLLQALGISTVKEFEAFLVAPNERQQGAILGAANPISGKARDLVAMARTAYDKFKKEQADNVPVNIDTLELYKNGKTRVAIRIKGTCEACFVPMRVLNALIAGDRLPEMVGVYASDRAVPGDIEALSTKELRDLQPKTPIRWDHIGEPTPGSKGVTTSPDAPEPRTYDLEIMMEVHGKPQSIGLLTRDIGGWGAGKHYRVKLSDAPDLKDTPLRFRTHTANHAKLQDLSAETLGTLEAELERLLSSTPSESYGATIVHALKEEIGPAKAWRKERDAERAEAVSKASTTLEDFQYGPGLIAEVAMHELMELAKRVPGVNRDD